MSEIIPNQPQPNINSLFQSSLRPGYSELGITLEMLEEYSRFSWFDKMTKTLRYPAIDAVKALLSLNPEQLETNACAISGGAFILGDLGSQLLQGIDILSFQHQLRGIQALFPSTNILPLDLSRMETSPNSRNSQEELINNIKGAKRLVALVSGPNTGPHLFAGLAEEISIDHEGYEEYAQRGLTKDWLIWDTAGEGLFRRVDNANAPEDIIRIAQGYSYPPNDNFNKNAKPIRIITMG